MRMHKFGIFLQIDQLVCCMLTSGFQCFLLPIFVLLLPVKQIPIITSGFIV